MANAPTRVLHAIAQWQRARRRPATGGEIARALGLTRQTIHAHAVALRGAGLLEVPATRTHRTLCLTEAGWAPVGRVA